MKGNKTSMLHNLEKIDGNVTYAWNQERLWKLPSAENVVRIVRLWMDCSSVKFILKISIKLFNMVTKKGGGGVWQYASKQMTVFARIKDKHGIQDPKK